MELEALSITARIFGSAENRARSEQKLVRRQQALSLLQNIVSKSLQAQTIQQMTEEIVGQVARLIHANECHITVWEKEDLQTSILASYGAGEDKFLPQQAVSGGQTLTELSLNLSRTLVIENSQSSSYINREIAKQCPARSLIVLPLIATESRFGALILAFKEYHQFPPEEVSICEQAANVIALAFEKFKALEKAQHRAATEETLRKAGAAITETRAIDETVNRILEQLKQVIPYDTASVQLLNRNGLKIIGGSGFADIDSVIGLTFPIPGNNPNTVVIETGKPYLLSETGHLYSGFEKPPHDHIRSWLGVPLIFQERVIGLLAIDSASPNQFTQETIALASEFANQVAVALENSRIYEKAQTQAITDPLTGVYNRWGMFQLAQNDFTKCVALNRPFSGIMIDLDHFKQVNDSYGHSVGDLVLREFAKRCKSCVREIDYVGRYGGEEFIIFLPETNVEMGMIVAERLRSTISEKPIVVKEGLEFHITASLGLAQRDENTTTLEMLITRADQAMYISKHKGRNCVSVST
jgi:diguanylate cyclase (GGDEF)-like protein